MDKLDLLQAFSFDGNVYHSRELWLKHFDYHLAAMEKEANCAKIRLPFFLHALSKKEEKHMRLLPLKLRMK